MKDLYYPIFANIGEPAITLEMIFNPYYPDKVKWRCKASRKRFNKYGLSR